MPATSRWNLRIENNCLFADEIKSGRVVLQHNARPGLRPYIHPLRGPDGKSCLTEDSPWHHPWQHGIQTGFHGVNGCEFWEDPGQRPGSSIGSIEASTPRILATDLPSWSIEAIWRHKNGSYLLAEQQTWSLSSQASLAGGVSTELLFLDLDWRLQAIPDIHVEQHAYGGLFARMPFREDRGSHVLNAAGKRDNDCDDQAAAWVDLFMPIDGSDVGAGITICDHPQNPGHPAQWRVDRQRGINPSPCIPAAIELAAGQTMRHRYRLLLHAGTLPAARIQELWKTYANEDVG